MKRKKLVYVLLNFEKERKTGNRKNIVITIAGELKTRKRKMSWVESGMKFIGVAKRNTGYS